MDVSLILDPLNPSQREAVAAPDGNIMVLAGAGSGKTRVLAHRIAWYVSTQKCDPSNIIAVTFTNKAATEMRSRIEALLNSSIHNMWVGTFHGLNHRLLRENWREADLQQDFTILDSEDQYRAIRHVMRIMSISESTVSPKEIQWFINNKKDAGLRPQHINDQGNHYLYQMISIYQTYEDVCKRSGTVDFAELLLRAHELLRDNPDILQRYHHRFKYILVDEFQDTNALQYAWLRLLVSNNGCLFAVGDDDQCLDHSTMVTMANHTHKTIADINVGDQILSSFGHGNFAAAKITACFKQPYQGNMIHIHLAFGKTITSTLEHTHFAGYIADVSPQTFLTCLMYKQIDGYHLCVSCIDGPNHTVKTLEFQQHMLEQKADALWIINAYDNRQQAIKDAQMMKLKYGLLNDIYHPDAGESLLTDNGLHFNYPHYASQQYAADCASLIITLCADKHINHTHSAMHCLSMLIVKQHDKQILQDSNLGDHISQQGAHWLFSVTHHNFGKIMEIAQQIRKLLNCNTLLNGQVLKDKLPLIKANNICKGMVMATETGNFVVVERTELVKVNTIICDINVDGTHNFIANGIVTHNSIYSWRGAKIENMQKFKQDFPDPLLVKLEQNYRSTTTILDAANTLITKNKNRLGKKLWTTSDPGEKIALYNAYNEHDEARYVAEQIDSWYIKIGYYRDSAIFYRVGAQSRVIEEQLMRANIPYKVYGGMRFYERAEIKDVLAYLRLSAFNDNDISFERIVNTPTRGIGQRTLEILRDSARQQACSLWQATTQVLQKNNLSKRAENALQSFVDLIINMGSDQTLPLNEIVNNVILSSGLQEHYRQEKGERGLARIENMEELVDASKTFQDNATLSDMSTLQEFLAHASLESGEHQAGSHTDFVSLMTLHTAKGLEFPNVYLVGMEEGLFPHQRNVDDPIMLEEERRLCYVGITRAEKRLTMTYAQHRRLHGKDYYPIASRFINELPSEFIEEVRMGGSVTTPMFSRQVKHTFSNDDNLISNQEQQNYALGQQVFHATFGYGIILALEGPGNNIRIQVKFEQAGSKWLVAKYANLTIAE